MCTPSSDEVCIRAALVEGEVVYPDTKRHTNLWQWRGTDESEQDIGGSRHAEGGSETCAGLATEGEGNAFKGGAQLVTTAATGSDKGGEALSEDAARAAGVAAAKAPDVKVQDDRHTADREIGDVTVVPAVDAAGASMAEGAGGDATHVGRDETHAVVMHSEIVDP